MRSYLTSLLCAVFLSACSSTAPAPRPEVLPSDPYGSTMEEYIGEWGPDEALEMTLRPGEVRIALTGEPPAMIMFDEDENEIRWRVENNEDGLVFVGYVGDDATTRRAVFGELEFGSENAERVQFLVEDPLILDYDELFKRLTDRREHSKPAIMTVRVMLGWSAGELPRVSLDGTTFLIVK